MLRSACAPCLRSFTEADQQIAATVGERKRVEKRSSIDFSDSGTTELAIGPRFARSRWRLCLPHVCLGLASSPLRKTVPIQELGQICPDQLASVNADVIVILIDDVMVLDAIAKLLVAEQRKSVKDHQIRMTQVQAVDRGAVFPLPRLDSGPQDTAIGQLRMER